MKEHFSKDSAFLKADTRGTRWAIPYNHECLNARVEVLLSRNREVIAGKRVLDLASHIGTMSYAALQVGAEYVHGVDTEAGLVSQASELFEAERVDPNRYRFDVGDVFNFLEGQEAGAFDTVLCFGLMYYTAEPYRLLKLMQRVAKECIMLDTFTSYYSAIQGKDAHTILPNVKDETLDLPVLFYVLTQAAKKDYALPGAFEHTDKPVSLTTYPSRALLELWFQSLGIQFEELGWSDFIEQPCHWRDLLTPEQKKGSHWADVYASGVRVAWRLTRSFR